jgi:hypothetical protein
MIYYFVSQEYFSDFGLRQIVALERGCNSAILNASNE